MKTDKEIFNRALVTGRPVSDDVADSVMSRYPWFVMPSVMKLGEALKDGDGKKAMQINSRLEIAFLSNNYYNLLRGIPYASYSDGISAIRKKNAAVREEGKLALIDGFLAKDLSRRVPDAEDGKCDNADLAQIDEDKLISEDIAEVYVKLGQYSEAKKIYDKLCLKYPEKSIYFAEIISGLERHDVNGPSGGKDRKQ